MKLSNHARGALALAAPVVLGVLFLAALNNGTAVTTNTFGYFITYIEGLLASQMTLALAIGMTAFCLFMGLMGGALRPGFIGIAAILIVGLIVPSMVIQASTALPNAQMLQVIHLIK